RPAAPARGVTAGRVTSLPAGLARRRLPEHTMYETLSYSCDAGVGVLTLARPQRLNAIDPPMARELDALLRTLADDPALRALIVTGSGRTFCAGADIGALAALEGAAAPYR